MYAIKSTSFYLCIVFYLSFTFLFIKTAHSQIKSPKNTDFFSEEQAKDLKQVLHGVEFIYLGENHEAMLDRFPTESILKLILKLHLSSDLICLFVEVPSKYNYLLVDNKNNIISYEVLLKNLPSPYHKMISYNLYELFVEGKILISFMDHPTSKSMSERNEYMAKHVSKKMSKRSCKTVVLVNGYRHLMNLEPIQGEESISLSNYFSNKNSAHLVFIPSYCKHLKPRLSKTLPLYFQEMIDNPRNITVYGDWRVFDRFIVFPQNNNCIK